jgi:MFS transporter, DHA1 family, multidrug resistance protein
LHISILSPLRGQPQIGAALLLVILIMLGNGIIAPVLSAYAMAFSVSTTMVGMVITFFGIGRLCANLPAGILSQRFGRRILLCLSAGLILVGSLGAATTQEFSALVAWRFVQGLGAGAYITTSAAFLADLARPDERGRLMALYQAGLTFGFAIGPAIGGSLARYFGLSAPFWAYGVIAAATLILTWLIMRETVSREPEAADCKKRPAPVRDLFQSSGFMLVCLVNGGIFFTRTASEWQTIPMLARAEYGMDLDLVGLALTLSAVTSFMMLPLAGSLIDRYSKRIVIICASLLMSAALVMIGSGTQPVMFWTGMIILGVGGGITAPAVAAYAADMMPRDSYGPGMGMLRSCGDIGFVLGPFVVGLFTDLTSTGFRGSILLNAAIVSVSTLIFALGTPRPRP